MAGCPSWASAFEELASGLDELKSAAGSPTFENPTFAPSWDVRSGRQLVGSESELLESELLESGRQIHGAHSGYGHGCCPLALVVFDMPNPNRYDILSISIFCKIPFSISISISIFSRMAISISISISIFFKLSLSISISISIFSKFPYRYFYRYRYFPNFLIDIFSISIFSK